MSVDVYQNSRRASQVLFAIYTVSGIGRSPDHQNTTFKHMTVRMTNTVAAGRKNIYCDNNEYNLFSYSCSFALRQKRWKQKLHEMHEMFNSDVSKHAITRPSVLAHTRLYLPSKQIAMGLACISEGLLLNQCKQSHRRAPQSVHSAGSKWLFIIIITHFPVLEATLDSANSTSLDRNTSAYTLPAILSRMMP